MISRARLPHRVCYVKLRASSWRTCSLRAVAVPSAYPPPHPCLLVMLEIWKLWTQMPQNSTEILPNCGRRAAQWRQVEIEQRRVCGVAYGSRPDTTTACPKAMDKVRQLHAPQLSRILYVGSTKSMRINDLEKLSLNSGTRPLML